MAVTLIHEAEVRSDDAEDGHMAVCSCGWQSETTCRKHAGWHMRQHFDTDHPEQCSQ